MLRPDIVVEASYGSWSVKGVPFRIPIPSTHKNRSEGFQYMIHVVCHCECGTRQVVGLYNLKTGKSTGCFKCGAKKRGEARKGRKMQEGGPVNSRPGYDAYLILKRRVEVSGETHHDTTLFTSFSAFCDRIGQSTTNKRFLVLDDPLRGAVVGNIRWVSKTQRMSSHYAQLTRKEPWNDSKVWSRATLTTRLLALQRAMCKHTGPLLPSERKQRKALGEVIDDVLSLLEKVK